MRSFALASGSSGNCFYVESSSGYKILVDVGIQFNKIVEILDSRGIDVNEINAVFITHEHSDHIIGLNTFMKNTNCPIYLSRGTFVGSKLLEDKRLIFMKNHDTINLDDVKVFAISKPHDSIEALSFVFDDGVKLGIFTDLGHVNDEIKHTLKTLDIVYFEANYCPEHIETNKHKFNLTYLNRLMSNVGHLGLHQTCDAIGEFSNDNQRIVLSHISENTNSYENVYLRVSKVLNEVKKFPQIVISFQGEPTEWIE